MPVIGSHQTQRTWRLKTSATRKFLECHLLIKSQSIFAIARCFQWQFATTCGALANVPLRRLDQSRRSVPALVFAWYQTDSPRVRPRPIPSTVHSNVIVSCRTDHRSTSQPSNSNNPSLARLLALGLNHGTPRETVDCTIRASSATRDGNTLSLRRQFDSHD